MPVAKELTPFSREGHEFMTHIEERKSIEAHWLNDFIVQSRSLLGEKKKLRK